MADQWQPGDPLPYDGWYNGDARKMIANGTYGFFRSKLALQASYGVYDAKKLKKFDDEWDLVPMDEKQKLFNQVVDDSTPQPVKIRSASGREVIVRRAKPSDDGNFVPPSVKKTPRKKNPKKIGGEIFLKKENAPKRSSPTK